MKDGTRKILDRLYNLKGEDSVILTDIAKSMLEAEDIKNTKEKEKKDLEQKITSLTDDINILEQQGGQLKNILKNIDESDFSVLIEKLQLDFNPDILNKKINETLPGTIATVVEEKRQAEEQLNNVKKTMENAITSIEELTLKKEEAVENQSKLNEFLKLALSGNNSLTREAIAGLLEKLNFSKEDQREAAKILMFPEDGLFEYEQALEDGKTSGKSISDIFHEAKENFDQNEENITPKTPDSTIKIDIPKNNYYSTPEFIESIFTPIEVVEPEQTNEIEDEINKEDVKKLLKECGFNNNSFSSQAITKIMDNFDSKLISENVEYVDKIGINKELFLENTELLYDKELIAKIDTFIGIGKVPIDIYLNPAILKKYTLEELTNNIDSLKSNGLDPGKVPLMAF